MENNNKFIDDFEEKDEVKSEGNFHDFNQENTIIGVLDRLETTSYGQSPVLNTENGEVWIGSFTALTGKFSSEDIGKKIKIQYLGEEKSKTGKMYKNFKVFKK